MRYYIVVEVTETRRGPVAVAVSHEAAVAYAVEHKVTGWHIMEVPGV